MNIFLESPPCPLRRAFFHSRAPLSHHHRLPQQQQQQQQPALDMQRTWADTVWPRGPSCKRRFRWPWITLCLFLLLVDHAQAVKPPSTSFDPTDPHRHEWWMVYREVRTIWKNLTMAIDHFTDLTMEDLEMIGNARDSIDEQKIDARGMHYHFFSEGGYHQSQIMSQLGPVSRDLHDVLPDVLDGQLGTRLARQRSLVAYVRSGDARFQYRLPCKPLEQRDAGMLVLFTDMDYHIRQEKLKSVFGWVIQVTYSVETDPDQPRYLLRGHCASIVPFELDVISQLNVADYQTRLEQRKRRQNVRNAGLGAAALVAGAAFLGRFRGRG